MIKKGRLICFIGIDGSGKTTLAQQKYDYLQKSGLDTTYVYGRVQPVISRVLMKIGRMCVLRKRKEDFFLDYDRYTSEKRKALKKSRLKFLLEWAFLIDQIIQVYVKIFPLLVRKTTICSDRYIYDTIVTDLALDFDYSDEQIFERITSILKIVPTPDIVFFIDVPPDIAFSRKTDVPHIDYLIQRKRLYDKISGLPHFIKIDGTKSLTEITNEINTHMKLLVH